MSSKRKKKQPETTRLRIGEVYAEVADLPPAERARRLDILTAGRPSIRKQVDALLGEARSIDAFLEQSVGPRAAMAILGSPPPEMFQPGDKLDDFEILRPLGTGSFATVYLARQLSLGRDVAIKVSIKKPSESAEGEARVMAQLEHDHIVKVYSEKTDKRRGVRVLCMQYIPGVTLDRLLASVDCQSFNGKTVLESLARLCPPGAAMDPAALRDRDELAAQDRTGVALWIGMRLAQALSYAHERGVLHFDVKPGNILMNAYGRPMLADFNVSRDNRWTKNDLSRFGGTFHYMAPEQRAVFDAENKKQAAARLDGRADLFALGKVVHEMLGDEERGPEVAALVLRCTAVNPSHRFNTARDASEAFESVLEWREATRDLPRVPRWMRAAEHAPLIALSAFGAIPQVVASAVGASYNYLRIVSDLTPEQQDVFQQLNTIYLPISYTVLVALWLSPLWKVHQYLKNPLAFASRPDEVARLRRRVLNLPHLGILVTVLGWIPGSVLYPLAIHRYGGPLSTMHFAHFLVSFDLSFLIALAYSYLIHQSMVLPLLYPKCFVGQTHVRQTMRVELGNAGGRIRGFSFLTGLIPLAAALIALFLSPPDAQGFESFRALIVTLITVGVVGIFYALGTSQRLTETVLHLSGSSKK